MPRSYRYLHPDVSGEKAGEKAGCMLSLQGVTIDWPSRVYISIGVNNGAITSVRAGEESALAGEGTLYI